MLRTNKQKELIDRERELSATSYFFLCCPSIAPLSDRAIAKRKISGHTQKVREGGKGIKILAKIPRMSKFKDRKYSPSVYSKMAMRDATHLSRTLCSSA